MRLLACLTVGIITSCVFAAPKEMRSATALWKDGIVPYQISSDYNEEDKKIVMNGINEFAKYTCIKFVQYRTSNQTDGYVLFAEHSSGTCFTGKPPIDAVTPRDVRFGFLGGQHVVSLIKSKGCLRKHTVLHKLMHILSIGHENTFDSITNYKPPSTTDEKVQCDDRITLSKWDVERIIKLYNCPSNPEQQLTAPSDLNSVSLDCVEKQI